MSGCSRCLSNMSYCFNSAYCRKAWKEFLSHQSRENNKIIFSNKVIIFWLHTTLTKASGLCGLLHFLILSTRVCKWLTSSLLSILNLIIYPPSFMESLNWMFHNSNSFNQKRNQIKPPKDRLRLVFIICNTISLMWNEGIPK